MEVTLEGSSPAATTAGIMLLTRARQLGYRLAVSVVGDPEEVVTVSGPALLYAPVLASCGVGREEGSGATVVVPGPPDSPLMVTLHPHGEGGWFFIDRNGAGAHPATRAFVRLCRDARPMAREVGRTIRRAMEALGLSTDPAVLDVLFGADVPPLTRIAVGLRAGRALSGGRGEPITRFVTGTVERDPLPPDYAPDHDAMLLAPDSLSWVFDGLSVAVRDQAERLVAHMQMLAREDGGRDLVLLYHLAELASQLVQLPPHSILPPLGAAEDSVATGLRSALVASGDGDANRSLVQMFRFLGGRYVSEGSHVVSVSNTPAPDDRIARWSWFCAEVRRGRKQADALWPNIVDPPS